MARIRSIHPTLTTDEAYMTMSMACKAAWPLLWTQCDDKGLFEWKPIVLKARIFPADAVDFSEILAEMEGLGCIRRYQIDGKSFGAVRNFCQFQRPKKPSYKYPTTGVDMDFIAFKGDECETSSPPVPHLLPPPTEKSPLMKEGIGIGEEDRDTNVSLVDADASPDDLSGKEAGKRAALDARLRLLGNDWNSLAAELRLPQIDEIKPGSPRERAALARIKEDRDMAAAFTKVRDSPFLSGQTGVFRVTFDWITNPTNLTKVLEGNYDEIRKDAQQFRAGAYR